MTAKDTIHKVSVIFNFKNVSMLGFKIRIFHCLNLICYSYGHMKYPLASYEKRMPQLIQLPSPEEFAEFLAGYKLHQQNPNPLQQKEKRDSQGEEGHFDQFFNQLKSFVSQIECFKSH